MEFPIPMPMTTVSELRSTPELSDHVRPPSVLAMISVTGSNDTGSNPPTPTNNLPVFGCTPMAVGTHPKFGSRKGIGTLLHVRPKSCETQVAATNPFVRSIPPVHNVAGSLGSVTKGNVCA